MTGIGETWLFFPAQGAASTGLTEIDLTSAAVKAAYPIPARCQILEWGVVVSTVFVAFTVKPIVKLSRRPLIAATAVDLQVLTLAASNTKLRKYITNPDAVAAGGPGTVTVGPSLGGHTAVATADTDFIAGMVVLGDTKSMPSTVLTPGDVLQFEVSTAGTVGSGKVVAFVRLGVPSGEQYTTAFVAYDAIP
jgi:hypothetical protein